MMKLKDIASKSLAGFVGTSEQTRHNMKHLEYFKYNHHWLSEISNIVLAFNGDKELLTFLIEDLNNIYENTNFILLHSENIGHTFGTMDNDRKIFEYAKDKDFEYIWKFSVDTIADSSFLDVEINTDEYDFFYINNVGVSAFDNKEFDQLYNEIISQEYFWPQTNYYIVKNMIKEWTPDRETIFELKKQYEEIIQEHPNIYPWDAIEGCFCENMLAKTIKNNGLRAYNLLNEKDNKKILDMVYKYNIGDGSHKNIVYSNVGNLCHFHYLGHPVAEV